MEDGSTLFMANSMFLGALMLGTFIVSWIKEWFISKLFALSNLESAFARVFSSCGT